jgi:hypothetical protein
MPRRTAMSQASYSLPAWRLPGLMTAAGGTLMFISMALFFLILIMTIAAGRKTVVADIPLTETVTAPAVSGWRLNLDYFHYWVLAAVVLAVAVYGAVPRYPSAAGPRRHRAAVPVVSGTTRRDSGGRSCITKPALEGKGDLSC